MYEVGLRGSILGTDWILAPSLAAIEFLCEWSSECALVLSHWNKMDHMFGEGIGK